MIALGCDHGGYELMQEVIKHLEERGLEYKNFGCYSTESVDYPVYGQAAAKAVASGECDKGIIICGTGIGISISANKIKGIRAALCHDCFSAQATREHNDANMLAMGARVIGPGLALKIVDIFLDTPFSNDERHVRRIGMSSIISYAVRGTPFILKKESHDSMVKTVMGSFFIRFSSNCIICSTYNRVKRKKND